MPSTHKDPQGDIRSRQDRGGPRQGSGGGAAYRTGYGAGGLGSGEDRALRASAAESNEVMSVSSDDERERSPASTPRIAVDGEGEQNPERWAETSDNE